MAASSLLQFDRNGREAAAHGLPSLLEPEAWVQGPCSALSVSTCRMGCSPHCSSISTRGWGPCASASTLTSPGLSRDLTLARGCRRPRPRGTFSHNVRVASDFEKELESQNQPAWPGARAGSSGSSASPRFPFPSCPDVSACASSSGCKVPCVSHCGSRSNRL